MSSFLLKSPVILISLFLQWSNPAQLVYSPQAPFPNATIMRPIKSIPCGAISIFGFLLTLLLACDPGRVPSDNNITMEIPKAAKKDTFLSIHGDDRIDPYYWMNNREDPEVIAYLNAENDYTQASLKHTEALQEQIYQEIVGRIKQDDSTVPYLSNGYYYYTRFEEGKDYPIYGRKKGKLEAPEEIMLNVNKLAEPYDFYNIGGLSVSPDNKLLAYGEDTLSRRIYTVRFKNLDSGVLMEDQLKNTTGRVIWANDNKTVFYNVKDSTLRSYKVFRHVLGTPQSEDVEVWHEKDATFGCYVWKTKTKKYIVIGSYQTVSNEYRYISADEPLAEFKVFQPRERDHEYSISHFNDEWYIVTNRDGATNFKVMRCNDKATSKEHWEEYIPHRKDVLIEDLDLFKDYLVLTERSEGLKKINVRTWEGDSHMIDFGEDAYLAYTTTNREMDTPILRLGYQSMSTPPSVYDYDMKARKLTLRKQQEIVGDFDPAKYHSTRIYAKARDGAKIPISLVYHKEKVNVKKAASSPLLVYGYGSYGNSMEPYFSIARLSLLDRGFVYAIAHIRGGQEMGRKWYDDGKLLKKKNTFTDFIDCTEHLLREGYGDPHKVYAMGGSAGGLLVGAVINMRPDLYHGVVAAVPFVDVVTTMLDESIPLTTGEFDEWGNPKNKEYYDYIKSYSPYDNIEAKEYPNLLVTTGLHDSQVQYWEPAKWVARLRELKTDDNLLLLHTNMEAGHGGASGRFRRQKETALQYSFLVDLADKVKG